jgi:hypothetical protein
MEVNDNNPDQDGQPRGATAIRKSFLACGVASPGEVGAFTSLKNEELTGDTATAERTRIVNPCNLTNKRAMSVMGLAASAVLCLGTGTAWADTASVQFQPSTMNNVPSLRVTITDTSGNGSPGTYGSCTFNATPTLGTMDVLRDIGTPMAPLNQTFQLNQGGQEQLNFAPELPTGTLWNVIISCTDPAQNQTGTIYNQPMPF